MSGSDAPSTPAGPRIRAAASASRAASASSNRNDGWNRGRSLASRSAARRTGSSGVAGDGPWSAPRAWAVEQRLEIAVGDERIDLVAVPTGECAGHRAGSSRSRATLRSARWMSTRTAPSDRPSTPAISAVDISSTKRRISARRRSSGSRATAPQAAWAASWRSTSPCEVDRGGDRRRGLQRRLRAAAAEASPLGDHVAGDLEEPDPEGRRALAVGRPGALLEPGEVRQRGEERPLGGVLRLVVVVQFVEREAVHLGQVLPIEGLEAGRVRLGGLDEPPVAVEVAKARTTLLRAVHLPECRSGHRRYTPPATGSASRTCMISPTRTMRGPPVRSSGSATMQRRRSRVDTDRADGLACRPAVSRRTVPAGRHLARRSTRRRRNAPARSGVDARLEVRRRTRSSSVVVGRCGARPTSRSEVIVAARSAGSRPRPSRR